LTASRSRFSIERERIERAPALPEILFDIPGQGVTESGTVEATVLENVDPDKLHHLIHVAGHFHALCDPEALSSPLTLRSRRPGDRISPPGMSGSRKLQDLLVDAHVAKRDRDHVVVVTGGERVIWVPGFAVDREVLARARAERVMHLIFRPSSTLYRDRMRKLI
jgi:tRNA(Ile)-lysidine synthase